MSGHPPAILRQLYHADGNPQVTTGSVLITPSDKVPPSEKHADLEHDVRSLLSRSEFHVSPSPRKGLVAEIVLGDAKPRTEAPCIRVAYVGWRFVVGREIPEGFEETGHSNHVTSMLAAGLAVSEVFRCRFQSETHWAPTDGCAGDLRLGLAADSSFPEELDFGEEVVSWIGCGSIAFAAVHALSAVRRVRGSLNLVDPSSLSRSNLRKYVGSEGEAQKRMKAEVLSKKLRSRGISAKPYSVSVNEYARKVGFKMPLAICSTDTSVARRDLQAKLPRVVLNSWTGGTAESLFCGTSRHNFDGIGECLNCAYWSDVEGSLNLAELAGRTGTDPGSLSRRRREGSDYPRNRHGGSTGSERFLDGYFNACEGIKLNVGTIQRDFSVPFVAAIGGALLASSILAEGAQDHHRFRLDGSRLRLSMAPRFSALYAETATARRGCICKDEVYRTEFFKRWPEAPDTRP